MVVIYMRLRNKDNSNKERTELTPAHTSNVQPDTSEHLLVRDGSIKSNVKREINKNMFEIGEEIGRGNFGKVFKGDLNGLYHPTSKTSVAVKSITGLTREPEIDDILVEIKIMGNVNPHLNMVSMIGACTSELKEHGKAWILLEFCAYGDLKNYLIQNKEQILCGEENDPINNRCLIKWTHDIASGMKFLAENQVMHGDLAARNILLDEDLLQPGCPVAKVADFGLSKRFYDNVTYQKESRLLVPWKWMALEYLTQDIFTLTSDVWSFGVLFWEIFSFGRTPYGQQGYDEVLEKLQTGYQLECPVEVDEINSWSPTELFKKIAKSCFEVDSLKRPPFSKIVQFVQMSLSPDEIISYNKRKEAYEASHTENILGYTRQTGV